VDDPKPWARQPAQAQSHRLVLEASASCRCSKTGSATSKTFRADFGSWGMSWTSSTPRSTKVMEIHLNNYDSHPPSVVHSPLLLSTPTQILSSSADRSRSLGGCRPRYCSSTSISSHTFRSISCRKRRIWHSSNLRLRLVSCLGLELEAHAWAKKSCWTASARTRLSSCSVCTSPRAHSKATNPSSHMMMAPSLLSSSLSQARSYPYSSAATAFEGDGALH
jgi:hypothetical protein